MTTRLLLPALLFASISLAAPRPNIVCVFIDDMGYTDIGCFAGDAKTPCLDRMAAEGIRFTQFYVNMPICSPSRCALLTGQKTPLTREACLKMNDWCSAIEHGNNAMRP